MSLSTAACTPDVCTPASAANPIAPALAAPILIAKIRETFAVLHDIQWRAPWDDAGKHWVNLR